jgi:hypothetical protein
LLIWQEAGHLFWRFKMQKLKIDLENCYGIKKLENEFSFSNQRAVAIYAPNGVMKSSLAQTFLDLSNGEVSKDRIFTGRTSIRKITDENGTDITKEQVFVIKSYDEAFSHSKKTSTLLVNSALRKEYEQLYAEIDELKEGLLKNLKEQSGSKKDIEKEISLTFTATENQFYVALRRLKEEILNQKDAPFSDIAYDKIFDEKVLAFLNTKDFKTAIKEYMDKYNELLAASTYFKKGVFDYYNAGLIAKSLADNGFFEAKHSVTLNADAKTEITSKEQLEELIENEKNEILKNKDLKKRFEEIQKQITKNETVRIFNEYLSGNNRILPKLENLDAFKQEIWKSYLTNAVTSYKELMDRHEAAQKRKLEIEEEARKERTQWENVIDIFNRRFYVPFKLEATNRVDVILAREPLLNLGFTFKDGTESVAVEKDALLRVLSTGERKALYVLNIIFEVEARKQSGLETIFVVDDIADSFDYKNKYAIIEYLEEISEHAHFRQIILTHNFDFFRTINSRFVGYNQCFMAFKTSNGLNLKKAEGIKNIFVNDWKPNFFKDSKKRIASIPFIRNIIEYTKGEKDPNYLKLTALLHWKNDSNKITQADLDKIYGEVFGGMEVVANGADTVLKVLNDEVKACLKADEGLNFENKIVLSIAIRLAAESFMIKKIKDQAFVDAIELNQSRKLFDKFKDKFPKEKNSIEVIGRVILMTPESIHLNSFMYEPILDMSDEHLRQLYIDVSALKS